jgi:aminocarboxymuconate-semialdehyde decarboxylase
MLLDVHNHVFPPAAIELVTGTERYGISVRDGKLQGSFMAGLEVTPQFFSPEAKLADLEAQGLDGAIISPVPSLFPYGIDVEDAAALARTANEGMAEMCAGSGGRLNWMATVPLAHPDRAVAELEMARRIGCVGVHIGTTVQGRNLDDDAFAEFWSAATGLGLVVMIHPTSGAANPALDGYHLRNVIGHLFETTAAGERLIIGGVLDRNPNLRVILVHGGGAFPYQAGRLRHARTVRRELQATPVDPWSYVGQLIFDTITHDVDALRFLIDKAGVENVVIGTDLPHDMACMNAIETVTEAAGTDAARVIAQDNPKRLFQLPAVV